MGNEIVVLQDENRIIIEAGDNEIVLEAISVTGATSGAGVAAPCTEEDFTITIDPVSGVDPAVSPILTTQAEVDSLSDFKTIPAALDALPACRLHQTTLSVVDGQHTLTNDFLGDLSRFTYGIKPGTGQITGEIGRTRITSKNGLVIAPSTSPVGVFSQSDVNITTDADPGLAANAFRNYMMVTTSGTGSGQTIPITAHAGTSFTVARPPSPGLDDTSVFEIRSAAAQLLIPSAIFPGWKDGYGSDWTLFFSTLIFDAIDLVAPAGGKRIDPVATSFTIDGGSRFLGIQMVLSNAGLNINTCALDGRGEVTNLLIAVGGMARARTNGFPWMARGATQNPIRLLGGGSTSEGIAQAELYGGTIDGVSTAAIEVSGNSAAFASKIEILRGSGHTYAVHARFAGQFSVTRALALDANYLSGSANDVLLGNTGAVGVDFTDVDADPNDIAIGPDNATVALS